MKNLIKILPILFFSLIIFSCKSDDIQTVDYESTLIAKDNLYGAGSEGISEQNLVITDQSTWNDLMTQMDAVNNVTDSFSETNIDFSAFQIIAIFDELKGSGGHDLELNITSSTENIIVTVTDLVPQGAATSVVTQPFHIVKIANSDLPVIFE